jgi:hypothetical protein
MTPRGGRARRWWTIVLALGLLGGGRIAWAQPAAPPAPTVETRAVPGLDVKQVNAQGIIDAPPHVVRAVVADLARYPEFMPYVKESRILSQDTPGEVTNYQRLSFGIPLVQDRHYVIRITERGYRDADRRRGWAISWRLQDGLPPGASPDAIRVSFNSGYWDLRPVKGSDRATDTRYCVLTDPAGSLPKWIVGMANTEGVPQIFAAVASAAASPRYASLPPPPEEGDLDERPAMGDCAEPAR